MEVWCPNCNAKIEIDTEKAEPYFNDWMEDQQCESCGESYDIFIELEPTGTTYSQRFVRCAECNKLTKHIKLRRNPYVVDNKKYCEECFNANILKWAGKIKEDKPKLPPRKKEGQKTQVKRTRKIVKSDDSKTKAEQ